jgi:hypothetical protein
VNHWEIPVFRSRDTGGATTTGEKATAMRMIGHTSGWDTLAGARAQGPPYCRSSPRALPLATGGLIDIQLQALRQGGRTRLQRPEDPKCIRWRKLNPCRELLAFLVQLFPQP